MDPSEAIPRRSPLLVHRRIGTRRRRPTAGRLRPALPDTTIIRRVDVREPAGPRLKRVQPWAAIAGFAFLVHFVWEMWQAPLYRTMVLASHVDAVRVCSVAALGDAFIQLLAYAAGAFVAGSRAWLTRPLRTSLISYVSVGLLITALLEWVNVYALGRWAYDAHMPVLLGIGLAPLLQWIVIPPLVLWLAARHLGVRSHGA
jgi:hypothetical protein